LARGGDRVNGSGGNLAGCATCAGRCCREYRVQINVADLRELAAGTALPPGDFVRLEESSPDTKGFQLRPAGPAHDLVLLRHPATGGCVLLMEIAPGLARCGVYTSRPLVCRNFPTRLYNGAVGIRDEVKCGPDAWNLATMDVGTYRRDLMRSNAAWTEHRNLVSVWNQSIDAESRRATPENLYDFLLNRAPGEE
jgi:Fe-S-cluster containining protein